MLIVQHWVQMKYRLNKKPSYKMMMRTILENQRIEMKVAQTGQNKKDLYLRSNSTECYCTR